MSDQRAEVLSKRRVYSGKLLKIDVDHLRLPGGNETVLETIRHPGAAAVLPVHDDGSVTLIYQYRHAVGRTIIEIPAGKIDPGETPEACALREVEEEVGWRAGRLDALGAIYTTPGFTDETIWLYLGRDLVETAIARDADEVIEVARLPFADALAMVGDGRIQDAKSVAAILHTANHPDFRRFRSA